MSLIATFALAASAGATLPQCNWDRPGVDPFMGDLVAAVDRYQDIPAATRAKLKARMQTRNYDDIAVIERDSIHGKASYAPEIRDMHFGAGSVCRTVTRVKWTAQMQERGLVYCEDGQCILVPTVCRNVSRIRRLAPAAIAPAQAANVASSTREGDDAMPLEFEAPAAGPMAAAAPDSFAGTSGVPTLGGTAVDGGGFSLAGGSAPGTVAQGGGGGAGGPGVSGIGIPALPPGTTRPTDSIDPPLDSTTPAVPEPGTWAMLAAGLLAVIYRARRSRGAR
jgi:hypothetical protein